LKVEIGFFDFVMTLNVLHEVPIHFYSHCRIDTILRCGESSFQPVNGHARKSVPYSTALWMNESDSSIISTTIGDFIGIGWIAWTLALQEH
jgi:hypothetical protein